MKTILISLLLLGGGLELYAHSEPESSMVRKQRRRVVKLHKKWEWALQEKAKAEEEIEKLEREIDEAELALIREQINEYHEERGSFLFVEEREILYRLIQSGSEESALEAQCQLDRILQIITEQSDEENCVY